MGRVENERRPTLKHFHPGRPANFGQSAADRGFRNGKAERPQLGDARQGHRRIGRLVRADQR